MKRVFIIHGYDATPEDNWLPWLKKELEAKGFDIAVPQMPEADNPTLEKWLSHIQQLIGECDENTFLVGHSLGTITILRFLEALPENQKVGGVVLVGGFSESLNFKPLKTFTEKPLDYEKIKRSIITDQISTSLRSQARAKERIVAIHSTDDPSVPFRFSEIIRDKLSAELITLHGLGHINWKSNCLELPQALVAILKMNE
ncbi:MAG: alpha/beta hydrolase [bacterium]|nr:alpha/beta hydrolase [bacterium]